MKLKKLILILLIFGLAMMSMTYRVQAATPQFQNSPDITVAVNGKLVSFPDQPPVTDVANSRTLVPVRFPAETLGDEVGWKQVTQEVTIDQEAHEKLPDAHLVLKLNSTAITVNGVTKQMDTTPVALNQRTMVPIRFIGEYLGAEVKWWQDSKTVHVFTQGQTEEEQQKIIDEVAQEIGQQPAGMLPRTIDENDTMFDISFTPKYVGTGANVVVLSSKDGRSYRWVCTNYDGMNTFHTTRYSTGEAVVGRVDQSASESFSIWGKGYDTTLKPGMTLTYNVYDSNNNLVRIVDFQL